MSELQSQELFNLLMDNRSSEGICFGQKLNEASNPCGIEIYFKSILRKADFIINNIDDLHSDFYNNRQKGFTCLKSYNMLQKIYTFHVIFDDKDLFYEYYNNYQDEKRIKETAKPFEWSISSPIVQRVKQLEEDKNALDIHGNILSIGDKVRSTELIVYFNESEGESVNLSKEIFILKSFNWSIFGDYVLDYHGKEFKANYGSLELVEKVKKIEYREDLLNIADDIAGVILQDQHKAVELIPRFRNE